MILHRNLRDNSPVYIPMISEIVLGIGKVCIGVAKSKKDDLPVLLFNELQVPAEIGSCVINKPQLGKRILVKFRNKESFMVLKNMVQEIENLYFSEGESDEQNE
jgi:hypothetical protein